MTAAWYRNNFNKQTHLLMASSSLNTKLPVSEDVTCDQLGHTYLPPPPHYDTEYEDDQHSITGKWSGRNVTSPIGEQAQTSTLEQSRKIRAPQAMTIKDTKDFVQCYKRIRFVLKRLHRYKGHIYIQRLHDKLSSELYIQGYPTLYL